MLDGRDDPRRWSRRGFLGAGTLSLLALAFGPKRARALAFGPRRLRMLHTHTGERLDVTYAVAGARLPEALAEVDRFLRDFRTGDVHSIDADVLDVVWSVAQGSGRPLGTFEIVSGYRSPQTNAMLREERGGVALHSMHLEGKAIDLRLEGVATARVHDVALALRRGGVGFYPASDFVHVDTGRVRRW